VLRPARVRLALVALAVCAAATPAGAQLLNPRRPLDPQGLQEPRRAPLTITPSLTLFGEYNDNINLDNDNKQWDILLGFAPEVSLEVASPTYSVLGDYLFTGEIFARDFNRSHAFDRHSLFLDGMYRVNPRLTLAGSEAFAFTTDTNIIPVDNVATGRTDAWANTLTGGALYRLTNLTSVRGGASYTLQRFGRSDLIDSDVYHANVDVERALTPRLRASLGYEYGFFDIRHFDNVTTHTPRAGASYRFTETITGSLVGGPTFEIPEHAASHVVPAARAALTQRYEWGSAGIDYSEEVGTASGLGGTTVNQTAGLFVQVTSLMKGLVVDFGPRWGKKESHDHRIDVRTFTLPLAATYRITPWMAVVGSYTFFHQRGHSEVITPFGAAFAGDLDQNRVRIGVQIGYPIRFE
jgi:hypothetical protein